MTEARAFSARDVEKLLRLPRSTLRALVAAGFVEPARGPRGSLRFSFQDMIVLRTAQSLVEARVPPRRITRALQALRAQLPETMPLSGLSIGAVGDQVVVRENGTRRQADTGQYLLAFDSDPGSGGPRVIAAARPVRRPARPPEDPQDWFDAALARESEAPEEAAELYRRVIAADACRLDARINLGRLLHERGALDGAEAVYREALAACGADPVLHYNLGVVLEDRGALAAAAGAYEAALAEDPDFPDACYNLALLCRRLDRPRDAIRHMARYRRLCGAPAG